MSSHEERESMRRTFTLLAAALIASPAAAQQSPQQQQSAVSVPVQLPAELTDPTLPARMARVMQVLSKSILDMPVGEVEAAMEGRKPTAADRKRTVRQAGRDDDPNFERNLQQQIASSQPLMEASMKAMVAALPAMMQGMTAAARELEKVTANLPSPTYPKK
jgi:hypothetical protein